MSKPITQFWVCKVQVQAAQHNATIITLLTRISAMLASSTITVLTYYLIVITFIVCLNRAGWCWQYEIIATTTWSRCSESTSEWPEAGVKVLQNCRRAPPLSHPSTHGKSSVLDNCLPQFARSTEGLTLSVRDIKQAKIFRCPRNCIPIKNWTVAAWHLNTIWASQFVTPLPQISSTNSIQVMPAAISTTPISADSQSQQQEHQDQPQEQQQQKKSNTKKWKKVKKCFLKSLKACICCGGKSLSVAETMHQ